MIHRFVSQNTDYVEVVNLVQEIPPQEKTMIYNIYREFIPKNNKWNKYIKSTVKKKNPELIEHLRDHFKCSSREVNEYLILLDTTEISRILTDRGLDNKRNKKNIKMSKLVDMLRTSAQADKAKAMLSLELLGNKAVGIGDHSTGDFYKNAEEALIMLVDADDRLSALDKYFNTKGLLNG